MRRGIFLCSASSGNPLTLPESISTADLSGTPIPGGGVWDCYEVPIDELSKYGTKALNMLERFGVFIFE